MANRGTSSKEHRIESFRATSSFLLSFLSFPFLSFLSSPLFSSPFLFSPLHIFDPTPNSKSSVIGHSKLCTRVERASIETTRAEGTRTIFRLVPSKLQFPRREKDVWWIRTSTTMDKRKKWTEGLTISTRTNTRFRIRSKRCLRSRSPRRFVFAFLDVE